MSALYNPKENCIHSFHCKAKHSTLCTYTYKQTSTNGLIIDVFLCLYLMYYSYFDLRFREVYLKMSFNLKEN